MSIFLNPVVFSVILMCILCLCKLNVMFSLIIACFVGGLMGGMSVSDISSTMLAGFSNNAEAALAYILLGTFASCLAIPVLLISLQRGLHKPFAAAS